MEFFFGKTCDADSRDAAPFVDRTTSRFESCESLCGLIVCVRETYSISESEKIMAFRRALCVFSLYSSLCACFIFPNSNP